MLVPTEVPESSLPEHRRAHRLVRLRKVEVSPFWELVEMAKHADIDERCLCRRSSQERLFAQSTSRDPTSPISYTDLPAEAQRWLADNGYDTDRPDIWVLVTLADGPTDASNVIDSREVII
ncbi:hypothetical protein AB0392_02915 [Nonomuraea angiospora]|uniref:hypothetical protein n=1 Tax=Nonomuraea angiospora TaxID=46172 RepID=UPI00344F5028